MNLVVLVAVGWALLLVAAGLLLARAMRRADKRGAVGRHRAKAKRNAADGIAPHPAAAQPENQARKGTPEIKKGDSRPGLSSGRR